MDGQPEKDPIRTRLLTLVFLAFSVHESRATTTGGVTDAGGKSTGRSFPNCRSRGLYWLGAAATAPPSRSLRVQLMNVTSKYLPAAARRQQILALIERQGSAKVSFLAHYFGV